MHFDHNIGAIIALSLAYVAFGALWYSSKALGCCWKECCSVKGCDTTPCTHKYLLAFLNALILTTVLSIFVHWTNSRTFAEGAHVGFWTWLGFIFTTYFSAVIWQKMHMKEFFIHLGYSLIALLVMGGILAVWH